MDAYKRPSSREILLDLLAEVREMRKVLSDLARPSPHVPDALTQEERDFITAEWVKQVLAEKDVDTESESRHKRP